jgi:feruloyl esterase
MKRLLMITSAVAMTALVGIACSNAPASTEDVAGPTGAGSASCEILTSLMLPNTAITGAESVAAGAFAPPVPEGGNAPSAEAVARTYGGLPAFCRVVATLTPSDDSDIEVEVWLPSVNWNGKYQAVGNGAFTGSIRHNSMAAALAAGYATSSTDTGHLGNTASFGLGHPEKVVDFGERSIHEMSVVAKEVIAAHYDEALRYSYWNGCSAGGRQAMVLAQRFPEDFDGIVAGAPGNDWTGRAAGALRVATHLEAHEEARLSEDDRLLVHRAAIEACDAADGVEDGVIDSPERCDFDPDVLECSGAKDGSCLTAAQLVTVRMMYSSPVNPKTGRKITGAVPGSELNWTDMGWTRSARATGLDQYRYLVYADESWTIDQFDFDTDIVKAEEMDADTLNALDPDLGPFFDRGGKLIAYHGWSDAQISPLNATQYHRRVVETVGSADDVHDSYRLFMAPGMGHCGGGEGPSVFDKMAPLEAWVEEGTAPDQIVASKMSDGTVDRTRPLCPYPQVAVYRGSGSTDDAANFVCQMP